MNIDERIERLTERHEALAQSVELLTADVRHLAQTVQQQGENIGKVLRIIEIQHERITRLEGGA